MAKVTGKAAATTRGKTPRQATQGRATPVVKTTFATTGYLAKTRLKKSGGSLVATVPAPATKLLHLSEGQEMAVTVEGNRVVLEPMPQLKARPPRYTLDELLAQCDFDAPYSDEERAWLDEPPAGREIL